MKIKYSKKAVGTTVYINNSFEKFIEGTSATVVNNEKKKYKNHKHCIEITYLHITGYIPTDYLK